MVQLVQPRRHLGVCLLPALHEGLSHRDDLCVYACFNDKFLAWFVSQGKCACLTVGGEGHVASRVGGVEGQAARVHECIELSPGAVIKSLAVCHHCPLHLRGLVCLEQHINIHLRQFFNFS